MGTVDDLIAKGVQNFYWDSYLCTGRMTFSQAVTKKYPHSFIMGEQGIDVDSLFTGGLPWMGMQAGVWDPSFEPMNSVLQRIVNPLGTAIVAAYGSDQNVNHTCALSPIVASSYELNRTLQTKCGPLDCFYRPDNLACTIAGLFRSTPPKPIQ